MVFAGASMRASSIRSTRTFVSHGHGTLCTLSSCGLSSTAVVSAITGIFAFCGVLLPIAPRKASRTRSSSRGARSSTIGDRSSLTHHAVVEDSDVGDFVFVGYGSEIRDSEVGDGSFIYHGARIEGVEVPEKSFVGPGKIVSDQKTADALPKTDEVDLGKYYNRKEQLDTNTEFAQAYIDLYEEEGYDAIVEVGPNPKTSWNQEQVEPEIGDNVELQAFSRVTGDVNIGENSSVGRRSALRADEGDPISVGAGAAIDDRVTLHATRGSAVRIGKFLVASDDSVLHGPLEMGQRDFVGENAVVFRARVGDDVQIGEGAVVAGPAGEGPALEIPDGTLVPAGAVVTTEKDVRALKEG